MSELDEKTSLAGLMAALRDCGFEPSLGAFDHRFRNSGPQWAVWVVMPGIDARAVVTICGVVQDPITGQWQETYEDGVGVVAGYCVGFADRQPYGRYRSYGPGISSRYSVFVDDIVATIREWLHWESAWSVTASLGDAARRLSYLRRLAAARLSAGSSPIDLQLDPLMIAMLDPQQVATLHDTVDNLFPAGIRWRFPRDKTGAKFVTKAQVLLMECAPPAHPNGRGLWLVVDGPVRRDEQQLTLRLASVRGKSRPHRWDSVPEHWRAGHRRSADPRDVAAPGSLVARATEALLAGHTRLALAMCGVDTDAGAARLLDGLPYNFQERESTERWVTNAAAAMVRSAPWRWQHAVAAKERPRRLDNLGGSNPNRRPGLFLQLRSGRPLLTFDVSASPLLAPRVAWERDIDCDLIRHNLLTPSQIPMPPS